jgi:hypothetical protein
LPLSDEKTSARSAGGRSFRCRSGGIDSFLGSPNGRKKRRKALS